MITAIKIGSSSEQMHLHLRPFRWPWQCVGAIRSASPNAAWPWPGLHQKPLYAAIGRLLAPYHPGGCQGDSYQYNDDATYTHFTRCFDDHWDAAVLYCAHCPMEEVCGFHNHKSHWTPPSGEHCSNITQLNTSTPVCFGHFIVKKSSSWHDVCPWWQ